MIDEANVTIRRLVHALSQLRSDLRDAPAEEELVLRAVRGLVDEARTVVATLGGCPPSVTRERTMADAVLIEGRALAALAGFYARAGRRTSAVQFGFEALSAYERATSLVADDPVPWLRIGTLQWKGLGDASAARAAYVRAIANAPRSRAARRARRAMRRMGPRGPEG